MKIIIIILLSLVMISCSSTPKSKLDQEGPAWIDGKVTDYPDTKFFVGVGMSSKAGSSADKLTSAKDGARAEIAKIFKTKIQTKSTETSSSIMNGDGKYSTRQMQETYNSFVQASTDLVIEGVEIKDSYKSSRGEVYALALLEKSTALNIFKTHLEKQLAVLKSTMGEALSAEKRDEFLSIRFYRKALLAAAQVELLNVQVVVAGGSAIVLPDAYKSENIKVKIDKMFSELSVSMEGEDVTIKSYILEMLTGLGMRVATGKTDSDFTISYTYNAKDDGQVNLSETYVSFKARANLHIEFFKKVAGKVVGKVNLEGRGVGQTKELASEHAVNDLKQVVRTEFLEEMFKFL